MNQCKCWLVAALNIPQCISRKYLSIRKTAEGKLQSKQGITSTVLLSPQTNLPIFKLKESSVRRRYSDFEWLRAELERESKVSH